MVALHDVMHGEVIDHSYHAMALDEHRALRVEAAQRVPDARLELLLARLHRARRKPEHRAAVFGERFQVEHLCAL